MAATHFCVLADATVQFRGDQVGPREFCMTIESNAKRESRIKTIRAAAPGILPSLLQCDFGDLRREVQRLEQAGTEVLHLDVMDGRFVPNLTYGMPVVEGLRRHTDLFLDVHLMISDPLQYASAMVDAGADLLTFHQEAVDDPIRVANEIASLGVGVGIAINPDTEISKIDAAIPHVDMVLIMSVNAGFGGQSFNPISLEKLRSLRNLHPELLLQIDGGIKRETIGDARSAGCDLFVVGSAIFGQSDYGTAIEQLESVVRSADQLREAE